MRNKSSRQLVKQVEERQNLPFLWDVRIDGLLIDESLKQLVFNHYTGKLPFALATEDHQNIVYFLPGNDLAVWWDAGQLTLNVWHNAQQFQGCIKLALVAHRTFLGGRQIATHEKYKEICEQIKG